ncbi:MAG: hypothetical protein BWY65_01575 [Firmicutes bacterium ADurb.Bin373]|nr:MAG: hypothetical protein BWY65_01575 [Firmicutes bacterium ADurb.Bin373]
MLNHIIDGGVLSNFPIWIFDSEEVPDWPTFGFKVIEPEEHLSNKASNPFNLFMAILSTILEARDRIHELNPKSKVRTISIPSLGIKTTDFEVINQKREELFQAGVMAATSFFDGWDFDAFKVDYCGQESCSTMAPEEPVPGHNGLPLRERFYLKPVAGTSGTDGQNLMFTASPAGNGPINRK